MALKFLNKKGWHTGSLRNIENVWKAEQKHDQEQKKLEELRKQIGEEREKAEFRLLQEQAGLVPRQERLDFLYDSGLAVGKGSSDGFKALESLPKEEPPSSSKEISSAPGALFEEKPQSANDAWRKLHSDPLLLIRQREQEALARIKNNPVQMANIRKSVEEKKKPKKKKHSRKSSKHGRDSEDDNDASEGEEGKKRSHHHDRKKHEQLDSEPEEKRKKSYEKHSSFKSQSSDKVDISKGDERDKRSRHHHDRKVDHYSSRDRSDSKTEENRMRSHGKSTRESTEMRSYEKYSSSKSRGSEKDASSRGGERNRSSLDHNGKRREFDSPSGKSDSEAEEKRMLRYAKSKHESNEKRSYEKYSSKGQTSDKDDVSRGEDRNRRIRYHNDKKLNSSNDRSDSEAEEKRMWNHEKSKRNEKYSSTKGQNSNNDAASKGEDRNKRSRDHPDKKQDSEADENRLWSHENSKHESHSTQVMQAPIENLERPQQNQRRAVTKLSAEEKAAKLREMQMDAVLHEEQRWKRLKKASENDAQEASQASSLHGQNFLNAAQKSVYGAEKGGSSTIEESVRRRKYYSQGRTESNEGNAFRR